MSNIQAFPPLVKIFSYALFHFVSVCWTDFTTWQRGYVEVSGATVSFLGNLGESQSTVVPEAQNVLLLHGAKYRAENWERIGTLGMLSDAGYRVAAVDLPTTVR